MTDLERIAKIVCDKNFPHGMWQSQEREHSISDVRQTLEAMLKIDPSGKMVNAARHDWYNNHGPQSTTLYGEFIYGIWRAMIGAILSEPQPDARQPINPARANEE